MQWCARCDRRGRASDPHEHVGFVTLANEPGVCRLSSASPSRCRQHSSSPDTEYERESNEAPKSRPQLSPPANLHAPPVLVSCPHLNKGRASAATAQARRSPWMLATPATTVGAPGCSPKFANGYKQWGRKLDAPESRRAVACPRNVPPWPLPLFACNDG